MESQKQIPVRVLSEYRTETPSVAVSAVGSLEPLRPSPRVIYGDTQEAQSRPYQLGSGNYLSGNPSQSRLQTLADSRYHQHVELPVNIGMPRQNFVAEQHRQQNMLSQWYNIAQQGIVSNTASLDVGHCTFQRQVPFGLETNTSQYAGDQVPHYNDSLAQLNTLSFSDLLGMNMPTTSAKPQGSIFNSDLNYQAPVETHNANIATEVSENHEIREGATRQSSDNSMPAMQFGHFSNHYWNSYDLNEPPRNDNIIAHGDTHTPQPAAGTFHGEIMIMGSSSNQQNETDSRLPAYGVDVLEKQTAGSSSVMTENHNPDKGGNNIDLNQTLQQKPRRKKHRPKVVSENKLKRKPKAEVPRPTNTKGTQVPRRKYVRKNKTNPPSTPPPVEAVEPKGSIRAVKSCRRSLNFDLDAEETIKDAEIITTNASGITLVPAVHTRDKLIAEMTPAGRAYKISQTVNQELKDYITAPEVENCYRASQERVIADAAYENSVNVDCQTAAANSVNGTGFGTILGTDSLWAPSSNSSACASSNEGEEVKGIKRVYSSLLDVMHLNAQNLSSATHGASRRTHLHSGIQSPVIHKKRRSVTVQKPATSCATSHSTVSEACGRKDGLQGRPSEGHTTSKYYSKCPPQFNTSTSINRQMDAIGDNDLRLQAMPTWEDLEKLKKKRSGVSLRVLSLSPLMEFAAGKQQPAPPTKQKRKYNRKQKVDQPHNPSSCLEALASMTRKTKRRTKKIYHNTGLGKSNIHAADMQSSLVLYEERQTVRNFAGPDPNTVEALTDALEQLNIHVGRSETGKQGQHQHVLQSAFDEANNALVLYKNDSTMVPYENSFNPIRKQRQRAKVYLDDETNRVWRLLLENINSEGIDGTDEHKAKWWANERKVFRGRVDSFIARMRLVQGDRRFSPWKGSVVDSVVGVFLTQNVSDHLSSSAFMSMAAQFAVESKFEIIPVSSGNSIWVEELVDPDTWTEKTSNEPICDRISGAFQDIALSEEKEVVNSQELPAAVSLDDHSFSDRCPTGSNQKWHRESIRTGANSYTGESEIEDKAQDDVSSQHSVVSSQSYVDSPIAPTAGRISSCSDSNSEQEDITTLSSINLYGSSSFVELLKMAEAPIQHDGFFCNTPSDNQIKSDRKQAETVQNAECAHMLDENSRSSGIFSRNYRNYTTEQGELTIESLIHENPECIQKPSCSTENTSSCYVFEEEMMVMEVQKQPTQQGHSGLPSFSKKIHVTENNSVSDKKMSNMHTFFQQTSEKSHVSVDTPSAPNNNTTKRKRGSNGRETKPRFDWDSLRREAQVSGRRERTANTMDSVDWEAVRHADVRVIAETIKERGMNNMLAERIKDFLDRLVTEHGSIDLEWLRDVPPDKAKEYLLSIRGLGLKSVECVRLLTLHHLAFPVDTNVGRIAVRLGWVPLQPLPEALQLHLLELYPVLESIQKYLWPRLCKLDQRTLYELHYHLITFGKVFCTKRQPNCNACPLRGECRHFASAFASARLGLPAPEERSIMTSNQGTTPPHDPQVMSNLLALPATQENQLLQTETRVCEPIIEVPASPEPEQTLTTEFDIEDACFQDPDDIPTINISKRELAETVKKYMLRTIPEADMSKALVAISREAASIPSQKLKNVSRLRTEHQVYELPDNHILLDGLDKREPDDPGSYLLAIWTPGETANSIEPPEKRCTSEGPGELCEDVTCFCCNSWREASSQIVRGTLLIPCRTAMKGSFPLNGTYFQVNEVFADHDSSLIPLSVPRGLIWNLPRKTVYFGTSVTAIFRGLSTEGIQHCFWKGYVCVRGFDHKTRAPRPLMARLHFPASKVTKAKGKETKGKARLDDE